MAKAKTAKAPITSQQITPATIEILKNFAAINQTLLFPPGNKLITRSVKKHTYAAAEI